MHVSGLKITGNTFADRALAAPDPLGIAYSVPSDTQAEFENSFATRRKGKGRQREGNRGQKGMGWRHAETLTSCAHQTLNLGYAIWPLSIHPSIRIRQQYIKLINWMEQERQSTSENTFQDDANVLWSRHFDFPPFITSKAPFRQRAYCTVRYTVGYRAYPNYSLFEHRCSHYARYRAVLQTAKTEHVLNI